MKFTLPELKYAANALAPTISETTINFHYGKHHQAYVNNLNNLIVGTEFENADLATIIAKSEGPIFNNAAQVFNHTFYFDTFSPSAKQNPEGALKAAIDKEWGSMEKFKEEFGKAATTLFGSGWAWLVKDAAGTLSIVKTSNADTPLRQGLTPLLTFDVWEHAYYLDYQNRRPDHIAALWGIIDWQVVEQRFSK